MPRKRRHAVTPEQLFEALDDSHKVMWLEALAAIREVLCPGSRESLADAAVRQLYAEDATVRDMARGLLAKGTPEERVLTSTLLAILASERDG